MPTLPPLLVPLEPPLVLPPLGEPPEPRFDEPAEPPLDALVVPPVELACDPPVVAGGVMEVPLPHPSNETATMRNAFFMGSSYAHLLARRQLSIRMQRKRTK